MVAEYAEMERRLKTFEGKTIKKIEMSHNNELKIRLQFDDKNEIFVIAKFITIHNEHGSFMHDE